MPGNGTATINFGAFPGSPETEVDVAGQSGLISTSRIEAWVQPIATADHSADEHIVERLRVIGFYKVDGTLTIRGFDNASPAWKDPFRQAQDQRLFGQFTVGWAWV